MTSYRTFLIVFFFNFLVQNLFISHGQSQLTNETFSLTKDEMLFKAARVSSPQQEVLDVVGLGLPIFSVSNIADGTSASFLHNLRIAYPLQIGGGRNGFQLIFYGINDKIPYAVAQEGDLTSVYLPYQVHEHLKGRIEQALAARRKVQLKINLLPSGLREATWLVN